MSFNGAPGMTRTCDLLVRSQTLYPTELRARFSEQLHSDAGAFTSFRPIPYVLYSTLVVAYALLRSSRSIRLRYSGCVRPGHLDQLPNCVGIR